MQPEPPVVSVVVTTRNRLDLLRRALRSVESQTFGAFEIIVVDDESSDGTVEFLRTYRSRHRFRWESGTRCERANLRNRGAALASTDLLSFLDDDDEWEPQKLEKQVDSMRANPHAVASYCFTIPIGADGKVLKDLAAEHFQQYSRQVREGHSFEALARECLLFTSGVMVRKKTFQAAGGYQDRFIPAEDWHYYLCLAREGDIIALREPLVRYRVHDANHATGSEGGKVGRLTAARITAARDLLATISPEQGDAARVRSALLQFIAQNHYVDGRNSDSLRYAWRSFRHSPRAFSRGRTLLWAGKVILKTAMSAVGVNKQ